MWVNRKQVKKRKPMKFKRINGVLIGLDKHGKYHLMSAPHGQFKMKDE